ncbi:MAG: hypothetical protein GY944_04495 [bacterium]|nr:hypothetical protein [bacterium]
MSNRSPTSRHMLVNTLRTLAQVTYYALSGILKWSTPKKPVRVEGPLSVTRMLVEPSAGQLDATLTSVGQTAATLAVGAEGREFLARAIDGVMQTTSGVSRIYRQQKLFSALGSEQLHAVPANWRALATTYLVVRGLRRELTPVGNSKHTAAAILRRNNCSMDSLIDAAPTLQTPPMRADLGEAAAQKFVALQQQKLAREASNAAKHALALVSKSIAEASSDIERCVNTEFAESGSATAAAVMAQVNNSLAEVQAQVDVQVRDHGVTAKLIVPPSASADARYAAQAERAQGAASLGFFREVSKLLVPVSNSAKAQSSIWQRRLSALQSASLSWCDKSAEALALELPNHLVYRPSDVQAAVAAALGNTTEQDLHSRLGLCWTSGSAEENQAVAEWTDHVFSLVPEALASMTDVAIALASLDADSRRICLQRAVIAAQPAVRTVSMFDRTEASGFTFIALPEELIPQLPELEYDKVEAIGSRPGARVLHLIRCLHGIAPSAIKAVWESREAYFEEVADRALVKGRPHHSLWVDPDLKPRGLVVPSDDVCRLLLFPLLSKLNGGPLQFGAKEFEYRVAGSEAVEIGSKISEAYEAISDHDGAKPEGLESAQAVIQWVDNCLDELGLPARMERLETVSREIARLVDTHPGADEGLYLDDAETAVRTLIAETRVFMAAKARHGGVA